MTKSTLQDKLMLIFDRMLDHYGPQYWWPAETWFEMMVGAVLTQATSWINVEKAICNLKKAAALSPSAIREMDGDELAALIYPSGFYNAKAKKLKALAEFVGSRYGDDLPFDVDVDMDSARSELLAVHGIGEETADDILVYALNAPSFIIDSYTKRVFFRLGIAAESGTYTHYRRLFMNNLPRDAALFGEYHALIVRHNKDVCRKQPICENCCLLDICPTGQNAVD